MRYRSPANSAASSPPVPARISTMTFLSSSGSRGSSRRLSAPSSCSSRVRSSGSSARASSASSASPEATPASSSAIVRSTLAVLGQRAHGLLEPGALARQVAQLARVADDLGPAEQVGQLGEALLDLPQRLPHAARARSLDERHLARGPARRRARARPRSRRPRTRSSAAIATAHIAASGSRVVRRWNCIPGQISQRTTRPVGVAPGEPHELEGDAGDQRHAGDAQQVVAHAARLADEA